MKGLIKFFLAVSCPNFLLAIFLRIMIKSSDEEDKITTLDVIKFYYFLSCLIVVLPFIALIPFFLFEKLYENMYYQMFLKTSICFGIIASVIYLKKSKTLHVDK